MNMKKTIGICISMLLCVTVLSVTGTEIKDNAISSFQQGIERTQTFFQPGIEWNKTFGGDNIDWGNCVQQTADGGYIVAGTYDRQFWYPWNSLFYLLKTDANGNEEWSYLYGGDMTYDLGCVQQTDDDGDGDKDDGYIVTGMIGTSGNYVAFLGKMDASGNEEWSQTFGGSSFDAGYGVQQTSDGGYIIAGETMSYGAGMSDVWLIKTDASGNEEWNQTFGGTLNDRVEWHCSHTVQQTSDGGYAIIGTTESYATDGTDAWLIKTDASGNEEWNQTFDKDVDDGGASVQQITDGGYIITGYTGSWRTDELDVWLIKTDDSGNEEWDQTFGGSSLDQGHSVQQTTDGGYVVGGYYTDPDTWNVDVYLVKTDASGNEEWNQTLDKDVDDRAYCIQQTSDGGYIVTGQTGYVGMPADFDVWLIKLASEVELEIGNVTGGFGVSSFIKNVGTADAIDVEWSITFDGGIIILPFGGNKTGSLDSIVAEGEEPISTIVFGVGGFLRPLNITVSATASNADPVEKTVPAKAFFFFVKI